MGKDKEFKDSKQKKKKNKHNDTDSSKHSLYLSTSEGEEALSATNKKSKKKEKFHLEAIVEENQWKSPESHKKKSKRDRETSEDLRTLSPKKKSKKEREEVHSTSTPTFDSYPKSKIVFDDDLLKTKSKKLRLNELKNETEHHVDFRRETEDVNTENFKEAEHVTASEDHILEQELGWSKEDVSILIRNIEKCIPANDSTKYNSRVSKLNWNEIQFKNYSAEDCKDIWTKIQNKVRRYRLLKELTADALVWLEKPWSNFYGSIKKNRHPDMPKRPLSSFMLFYMDKKEKYSKKNPNAGMVDLSKIMGNKYQQLSDSKKAKYTARANLLKEEYNEKMKKFTETHPNTSFVLKKKSKESKHSEMPGPPRPLPPIKLFIEEKLKNYESNSTMSKAECLTEIKELWKHLSNKKKVPWIRWAQEAEKKYLDELEVYKSENPNFEVPKHKPLLSKEEITILERMEGKPEKPPNSAYSLFSRLMLKDEQLRLINFTPKERMKEISRLWAAVSDEEKKQYAEKAKNMLDSYKLEYATYLESLPEDKKIEELAKNQTRKKRKVKDSESEKNNGKKLKQTKISDSFNKKASKAEELSSGSESDDEETDADSVITNSKKVQEIKNKLKSLEPPKPPEQPFELFKEIYLTNPGNKESKARIVWESMPGKEKERYRKKLEAQKQSYMIKYSEFLKLLDPDDLKVYSNMKKSLPSLVKPSSDESSDEDSDDSDSEPDQHQIKAKATSQMKTKETSSSSSSDDSD